MTKTISWPTRQEYEAQRRAHAEHLIKHGEGYADEHNPTYTDAESTEIERMAPVIIKTIRRECGRIERPLRREYPEVIWLLNPGVDRYLSGEYDAAEAALTAQARAAYNTLRELRDIRSELREDAEDPIIGDYRPLCFDRFTSPEIDRLRVIRQDALNRYHARERERGRNLLAAIESGEEWEDQLLHRASVDAYFARGPVVRTL
jgi:hypothetical protein